MVSWGGLKREFGPMWRLALPLVLGELGWMLMGVVDTMMTGRLSKEAMGAAGAGSNLFHVAAMFGLGLLLGLDTLVSQAFGARNRKDCYHSLIQGIWIALLLAPLLMSPFLFGLGLLKHLDVHPAVLPQMQAYLSAVNWGTLPLLLYVAFRRYLQSVNAVRPVVIALVSANLVNAIANYTLIFGEWGMPALGVAGAGWATTISRVYMASVLGFAILAHDRRLVGGLLRASRRIDPVRIRRLLSLGWPAALQITLEIGVFAAVSTLIARLEPRYLAAHQIALLAASTTFMVPLGIGSAAAVRVGQSIGRRRPEGAAVAGWAALALGAAFMSFGALCFLLFPAWIARAFTTDSAVIATAVALLRVAALFQICDGIQAVATGALRGAGDTRSPFLAHTICYWGIGLPLGWFLAFHANLGAIGFWIGLCVALILIGLVLLWVWNRTVGALQALAQPPVILAAGQQTPPSAELHRAEK
jgi:MATE family multidrug resistance protein